MCVCFLPFFHPIKRFVFVLLKKKKKNYFSARKRAAKGTSIVKFTVKKLKVEFEWMRLVARNRVVPVRVADVTRRPVHIRGKLRIGRNVHILAVPAFNTVGSLAIESTLTNGSTRNQFHSDAIPPKGRLKCKSAILATVTLFTFGEPRLGSLAPCPNVDAKVFRNVHWRASTAAPVPGSRDPIVLKNSDPSARDDAGLLHVSILFKQI